MIRPKDFIAAVDDDRVTDAIRNAEMHTSCEFRVFVASAAVSNPVFAAKKQFARMKMHATRRRNAVLIFIAPKSRNFAIFADTAAHQHVGQAILEKLSAEMSRNFQGSGYTDGIVRVLHSLGAALAPAFPADADSGNELSDDVERG